MKLSEARAKHNLSQAGLAELVGMTQGQISNIEMGKSFPHAASRYKIEQALECKIDWIATKLSGSSQNLNTVLENESPEDRVIREIDLFIKAAPKAQHQEQQQFILNFVARKKRIDALMYKLQTAEKGEKVTLNEWEESVLKQVAQLDDEYFLKQAN